jgi:hypothetical protein
MVCVYIPYSLKFSKCVRFTASFYTQLKYRIPMRELSCVLDFWRIQLKAIRTCISCKSCDTCDESYTNKRKYHQEYYPYTVCPSVVKLSVANEEDNVLLSTYDIV